MYLKYYGLTEQPFTIAPNPRILYMSQYHQEALAHLTYGVQSGGFVLLTGEVGTGKTTLCRALLGQLPETYQLALILNPMQDVNELLASICCELNIEIAADSGSKECIAALNDHLLKNHASGGRTLLIIDEAQNLSMAVLEQLRLLTNLETDDQKLMQIILLGQPELKIRLAAKELRQLSQRITARYHLNTLNRNELAAYVNYRLQVCGVHRPLFSHKAFNCLYRYSRGTPRLINIIADRALLGAYAEDLDRVDAKQVRRAAAEILAPGARLKQLLKQPPLIIGSVGVTAAIIIFVLVRFSSLSGAPEQISRSVPTLPVPDTAVKVAVAAADSKKSAVAVSQPRQAAAGAVANELAVAESAGAVVPPAQPQIEPTALAGREGLDHDNSMGYAYTVLFNRWNTNYSPEIDGDPCLFAIRQDLQCLNRDGTLQDLQRFDRPALLNLVATDGGVRLTITLIGLNDDYAVITIGRKLSKISRTLLAERWGRNYTLLWRPPRSYSYPIRADESGPLVPWLATRRARLENLSAGTSWTLSGDLLVWLQNFQRRHQLPVSGEIDPLTLIMLQNDLKEEFPRLDVKLVN